MNKHNNFGELHFVFAYHWKYLENSTINIPKIISVKLIPRNKTQRKDIFYLFQPKILITI